MLTLRPVSAASSHTYPQIRVPAAWAALPRIRRALSFLLFANLSRTMKNASFTNFLLPITALSVKQRTQQRRIFAIESSRRG